MKEKYKISRKSRALYALLTFALVVLLFGCVYLDSVSVKQVYDGQEVAWAKAGDVATFKIQGHIDSAEGHSGVQFVVGFLAPKSWNVRKNAKVTYINDLAEDPTAELTMSVIPESSLPKNGGGRTWTDALMQDYGVGPNVLNDMEWVVFWTDEKWDILNGDKPSYTIIIRCGVGQQNLRAHLGFFINHTDDGISSSNDHKKIKFSDECFEVVEGKGLTIDFCNEHFNKVQPLAVLQDDYLTISFIGNVADNKLVDADNIYIEAVAHTYSGALITVNEKTEKTLMKKESTYSDTYNLTIWPGGFFNVPESEEIEYVEYFFTNKDRTVVISQSDDDFAQAGTAIEGEKKPFVLRFVCD